ncbi:glycosyltransferase [Sphingobacterium sp. SYP-B4668]|uniref:glycosyltransferase n=1 Tax=Sphingobacterium sp. SYP-B4668 TaxID=2996035 RepID=UPI0022DD7505|nr:glycosyltransferase [Sphingobacterium sp. SYP-B4668]
MIKVAFCIREDYKTRGGGDAVQMLKTKQYLEFHTKDIEIQVLTNPAELTKDRFDLCHIFNFSTYKLSGAFIEKAKSEGIKIAASPIYWDYSVLIYAIFSKLRLSKLNSTILSLEKLISKIIGVFYPLIFLSSKKFRAIVSSFVYNCDILLPNSEEEMTLLCQFIKRKKATINYDVVVNACEAHYVFDLEKQKAVNLLLAQGNIKGDFVLQVGRIEPIKNQINLVKALEKDSDIPIVFIGAISHREYYDTLARICNRRGNVYFISEVDHELIYDFYRRAKLHVLPSLRESPGLVSLEALSMGCPIIVSDYPYSPFETYFGEKVTKIDPLNISDIRTKVLKEFCNNEEKKSGFKAFTWEMTAEQTYNAYVKILKK